MSETSGQLARDIRRTVTSEAVRLRGIDEGRATEARGAGRWTQKEILGHLVDSALNNHQRFARAQAENPFVGPGYDQDVWVSMHRYAERPWADLIMLWTAVNDHLAVVVAHVAEDALSTVCRIGENEAHNLEWVIRDYLRHMRHHLAQLG